MKRILYLSISMLVLQSCANIGGSKIDNTSDLSSIKETLSNEFGRERTIYVLGITANDHLDNEFSSAFIDYFDQGKPYRQWYNKITGILKPTDIVTTETSEKEKRQLKIEDLDFDLIANKSNEAIEWLKSNYGEYEDFTLYSWNFELDEQARCVSNFVIEAILTEEKSKYQNMTYYYEFVFDLDKDGAFTLREES